MLLAMFSCVASAYAQNFTVDGLSYNVTKAPDEESTGEVEVTGGEIKEVIEFPETVTYEEVTYTVTSIGSNAFSGRTNSSSYTRKYIIPGTVRSIKESAFYDNYHLEEVEFNEGLQTIGKAAFGFNFVLKEIRIPSTVTTIGETAFITNRQNLATISCLAATPPAILGNETFKGRTDATLHVMTSDVEAYQEAEYWKDFSEITGDISYREKCYSPVITCDDDLLTISCKTEGATIYYTTDGSVPDENAIRYTSPISYTANQIICAIAIAEGCENSRICSFYDKESLENVTDEQGVSYTLRQDSDGNYYYSVTGHSDELEAEIVIPDDLGGYPVRSIEYYALGDCASLTSITIPSSVISIGDRAFYGCSGLKTVTSEISEPFAVAAFSNLDATLVVPKDSRDNYMNVDGWNFAFIFEEDETIYDQNLVDEQGVSYTLKKDENGIYYYSVTGHSSYDYGQQIEIVIPAELGGCPVRSIGERAFSFCASTSITIPSSVTSIGSYAFNGCYDLTSVTISSSITSIGLNAFSSYVKDVKCIIMDYSELCNNPIAKALDVSASIQLIDNEGNEITEYIIPEGVTSISDYAFRNCKGLTSITIPSSVTSIGEDAFKGCKGLASITIPSSVTSIGKDAFSSYVKDVKCIIMDYSELCNNPIAKAFAKLYGESASIQLVDNEGNEITEYIIPEGVTSIGEYAFYGCSSLSSVIVPEGVTSIGEYAFRNCSGLTSITIPNSVTSIGSYALWDCSSLKMVISKISTPFGIGGAFNDVSTNQATLVVPKDSRDNYMNVYGWNDFAFIYEEGETMYDWEQVDEQGVKYTLRQDEDGSKYYLVTGHTDELSAEVEIPADLGGCPVRNIGESAFRNCESLESITIPNSVTSIGANAFGNCGELATVKLSNKLVTIGEYAFSMCGRLSSITIPNSVTSIENGAFRHCGSLSSITLPNKVTSISDATFEYCNALTFAKMGENVTSIGARAFQGCSSLTSIALPEALESIGDNAFASSALVSIDVPNSVESIGSSAFASSKLETAILGEGITEIAGSMFSDCRNLSSVTIPDGVTNIGERAFWNCSALISINLPETLTSMGGNVFTNSALKSIELPNSFTVITEGLFQSNNFSYIKLGNNVRSIGKNAFGSRDLVLEIGTSTPPTISSSAFPNVEYLSEITVIVPDAKAVTAYGKKTVWEEMTYSHQDNMSEVTVDTPGDMSFELITECGMQPAKVVSLKVNGTINADDFMQILTNMKSLLRLDLSDCDITEIPDNALSGKTQLQELTLPSKLQAIGKNAFKDCPYLKGALELPSTLTSIGDYAFAGTYYTSVNMPYTLKTIGDYAFYKLPIEQQLVLPSRGANVGAHAFEGTKITKLSILGGVSSIGERAFAGTGITELSIQGDVTSIGDAAFADAPVQGHVTIPDGITYLGREAFKNTQISTVFLPNSVTTLSQGLFQGCKNLNLVYVPDNFTGMGNYAFDGCEALTTVRLSANTTTMGEYSMQGTPMEYVKVPSKVEVLSRGALKNCQNLVSLALPASLKTVEAEALIGCTALRNLSVEAIEPPAIKDRSAIRGINTDKCIISIPTQSYRAYVLAEYWGQFVQMRNDIAVETAGNGEITFESVEEEEEEEEEVVYAKRRGVAQAKKRAPSYATPEDALTYANNGSSIFVPKNGKVLLRITPNAGEELVSATLDGKDITPDIKDNVYVATADKANAKLVVRFSGAKTQKGDANGDGSVNVTDIISVANYILGAASGSFDSSAADMNGDGDVNVTDIISMANYILGGSAADVNLRMPFELDPQ